MSQRTLLIAALALMAGGLLLGIVGTVFSDTGPGVQSEQGFGPGPQQRQGPEGLEIGGEGVFRHHVPSA